MELAQEIIELYDREGTRKAGKDGPAHAEEGLPK